MSRAVNTLLLVLLIQCGLVVAVYWPQPGPGPGASTQVLAPFEGGLIDEVRLSNNRDDKAVLKKSGGRWLLPALDGLPADPIMVEHLLDNIANVKAGWPIAQSAPARQRFQVADYHHQRRIDLNSEGKLLATLYLGTSPGFRKVHARNASDKAIYSIAFNVFDAPASSSAWIDRKLLQIRTPVRITGDTYSVHREEGDWQTADGGAPDERELLALLSALRSLQVDGIANGAQQEKLGASEAGLRLEIESLSGNITLRLFAVDGEHFIHSSEYPLFFTLSDYDFDRLTGIDFPLSR